MPAGFFRLVAAQFTSALADHALLLLGVYLLQSAGHPGWWAPMLKFCLNAAYVVLASVAGPLADAWPKGRLMARMNSLKLLGVLLLVSGAHPAWAFVLIGMAAAIYAPCKYGLLTESVAPAQLVRANAWLEVSVVLSVILGTALGGALVAMSQLPWMLTLSLRHFLFLGTSSTVAPALALLAGLYVLSAVLNAGLRPGPWSPEPHPLNWRAVSPWHFWQDLLRLWRDPLGGLSLYVTSLYWGAGSVIQFAVLIWARDNLGLQLQHGAYLQALVAIGVIAGAFLAGKMFRLHRARQVLPAGLILPILLPVISLLDQLWLALPMMLLLGAAGGMMLVPMNALLQHRGRQVLRSGQSIAVQGFNENLSVLVMLSVYSTLLAAQTPIWALMCLLSAVLALGLLPIWLGPKLRRRTPTVCA